MVYSIYKYASSQPHRPTFGSLVDRGPLAWEWEPQCITAYDFEKKSLSNASIFICMHKFAVSHHLTLYWIKVNYFNKCLALVLGLSGNFLLCLLFHLNASPPKPLGVATSNFAAK